MSSKKEVKSQSDLTSRIKVQRDTIAYVDKHKSKFHTRITKYGDNMTLLPPGKKFNTNITVVPYDTLEAVINSIESP